MYPLTGLILILILILFFSFSKKENGGEIISFSKFENFDSLGRKNAYSFILNYSL
jgi:hypothetical protein